jgi:hypothetical protein
MLRPSLASFPLAGAAQLLAELRAAEGGQALAAAAALAAGGGGGGGGPMGAPAVPEAYAVVMMRWALCIMHESITFTHACVGFLQKTATEAFGGFSAHGPCLACARQHT